MNLLEYRKMIINKSESDFENYVFDRANQQFLSSVLAVSILNNEDVEKFKEAYCKSKYFAGSLFFEPLKSTMQAEYILRYLDKDGESAKNAALFLLDAYTNGKDINHDVLVGLECLQDHEKHKGYVKTVLFKETDVVKSFFEHNLYDRLVVDEETLKIVAMTAEMSRNKKEVFYKLFFKMVKFNESMIILDPDFIFDEDEGFYGDDSDYRTIWLLQNKIIPKTHNWIKWAKKLPEMKWYNIEAHEFLAMPLLPENEWIKEFLNERKCRTYNNDPFPAIAIQDWEQVIVKDDRN